MNTGHGVTMFLVKSAVLSAAGVLLTLLEFPLPFFPPFLAFNIADLPCLLGGFAGGPLMGMTVVVLKNLLFTALRFSPQQLAGMAANLLLGAAYVLPAALLYRNHRDRGHAIWGMVLGTAAMALMGIVSNAFITLPFYAALMGVDIGGILAMTGSAAFGTMAGYLLLAVLPFNLLRGVVMSLAGYWVYKPLSPLLHK